MSITPITAETVPAIWFKNQRVWRAVLTTVLTLIPLAPQVLLIIQDQWSPDWLAAVAAQAVAINAALERIIAIPVVNAFLTRFGLGSVPRSVVTGERPEVDVRAIQDPGTAAAALISEENRRD